MPSKDGQAYGLTVLSPIKVGEQTKVKAYIDSLPNGPESPFGRIGGRKRPTVHTARFVIIETLWQEHTAETEFSDKLGCPYLLFDANVDLDDRGIRGFLEDMARDLEEEIGLLYSHCYGFESVALFPDYIERCQVETTFFFTDYSSYDRGKVVNVQRALDTQARFVDLVGSGQTASTSERRKELGALLDGLNWPFDPVAPVVYSGQAPKRDLTPQTVDAAAVQGNVLRGYKFPIALQCYFKVSDPTKPGKARRAIGKLMPSLDHGGDWDAVKPEFAINMAFSFPGLEALGLPRTTLDSFPASFRIGMRERSSLLGDTGSSAVELWEARWQGDDIHVLVSIYANTASDLDAQLGKVTDCFADALTLVDEPQRAGLLVVDGKTTRQEHFGFLDGFGNVEMEGVFRKDHSGEADAKLGDGKLDENGRWVPLALGELLFGYSDEAGERPPAPKPERFGNNGTFLVFRKLRENVQAFRAYLDEHGARYSGGKELLAAKMVGRFRDGTPLALSNQPDQALVDDPKRNNNFTYKNDSDGSRCPLGAHIRRARPRDALGFHGKVADRRRMTRRGMAYGDWLPEGQRDDGKERGILFMAFNVDIDRQFEFIQQQWMNYGNTFAQGGDKDIIAGDHDGTGKAVIQSHEKGAAPYLCTALPRFVDTRGGAYFFVPGLPGIAWIAELDDDSVK